MSLIVERDPSPFDQAEYDGRIARVRAAMSRAGIELLLVNKPANMTWLTGYRGESDYVPQLLALSVDGGNPRLFMRAMDVSGALHTGWLPEADVIGYPEDWVGRADRDGYDFILDRLGAGTVTGIEAARFGAGDMARFRRHFGEDGVRDATGLVDWVRIDKSPAEIAVMRQAAAITDAAMAKAAEVIRSGVRECDAAAEICAALIRGTPEYGGHGICAPLMPAGSRTGAAHLLWGEGRYRNGQSVNMEIGGVRYGYVSALMRTITIGPPSDRLRRMQEACEAGLEAGLAAAKPGATCGEVAAAYHRAQRAAGGEEKLSRCGYSIGLGWLEPTASLHAGDDTVLRSGMTFHMMLGNWRDAGFGHVLSETFLVGDTCAEPLGEFPRQLIRVE